MKLLPAERRVVGSILLIFVLRMLGLFMLLPVLALYAEQLANATPLLVGMAVGGYGISQAMLQLPFGWASDRFGRRPMLMVGLLLFALGSLMAFFSSHAVGVVIGRVVQGAGAISAVLTALVGDHVAAQRRTRAMAFIGASIGMSFLLALLIGPLLSGYFGTAPLFLVAACFAVIALALVSRLPTDAATPNAQNSLVGSIRKVLPHRRLWPLNLGILVLHMVLAILFVALPFVLRDQLGIAADAQWKVLGLMVLASLPGTILLIKFSERHDAQSQSVARTPYAVIGLIGLSMLVMSLVLGQVTSASIVIVLGATFFSAFNFLEARLPAQVSLVAPEAQRGTALGVYASCQFLGVFVGGVVAGWAMGVSEGAAMGSGPLWAGSSLAFALGAAAALLWLVLARVFSSKV